MNQEKNITRRAFLAGLTLGALAMHDRRLFAQTAPMTVSVNTPSGRLRGLSQRGVRVFRGVPFAEPPVGALRFKRPKLITPWKGEKDATAFGNAPMQSGLGRIPVSEDCLNLNIWAPEGKGPYPVFVWVHGGGFTGGFSFDGTTDGTQFASEGIILITVDYRLGVFGFLDFGDILGSEYSGSANNGLADLVTALQWININIEAFGGDPNRVTVGGESAGAKLTGILMGAPAARPFFHQMISESGGAERVSSKSAALTVATGFSEEWQKRTSKDIVSLATADPMEIISAQNSLVDHWPQHFPLRCEVDGLLLPKMPVQTISSGNTSGKRLLIGTNHDESEAFDGNKDIRNVTASDLGNMSVAEFDSVFAQYPDIYPQMTPKQLRVRALTAEEYWVPSIRLADAHTDGRGLAWMYRLDLTETSGGFAGYAYHGLDVGLVWGKPHKDVANTVEEAALGVQMHTVWAEFINGGQPAATGLPNWPTYHSRKRGTMLLNTQSTVAQKPAENELKLWKGLL